jgi:hypothetical protein
MGGKKKASDVGGWVSKTLVALLVSREKVVGVVAVVRG